MFCESRPPSYHGRWDTKRKAFSATFSAVVSSFFLEYTAAGRPWLRWRPVDEVEAPGSKAPETRFVRAWLLSQKSLLYYFSRLLLKHSKEKNEATAPKKGRSQQIGRKMASCAPRAAFSRKSPKGAKGMQFSPSLRFINFI